MAHAEFGAKALHQQDSIDHKATSHHEHVAVAAYFLAEHRGFTGGDPLADWLAATAEIDAMLKCREDIQFH